MIFEIILYIYILAHNVSSQRIKTILVEEWAENFGSKIYEISSKASALNKLTNSFVENGATITKLDGMDVVQSMANRIEGMLQSKVEAVKRLVDTAEEAYKEYTPNRNIKIDYFNAKEVVDANSGQIMDRKITMIFKPHEQFDNIPINLTYSTIHVPTNVYNRDIEVLNNIAWSEKLNKVFVDNYNRDRTLMWQYFGSETGFFRIFPGIKWELDKSNIDLYDCRVKDWYIQAATSPKDLVILLDGSGSMTGLRIEIAKLTIETIMNTLSDDDFFNVLQFTGEPLFVEGCFNDTLVQGNEDNKNKIKEKLENIYTKEIARFDVALTKAFHLLNSTKEQNRGTNCNQAIMIITDGAPHNFQELFDIYNTDKHVRIFTYLIGREATDDKGNLKWMSCNNKGYFTHIATLADVQENVQEYIKVISRPMVIEQEHVTIWTGIYHTKADPKTKNWLSLLEEEMDKDLDTIRLMTSVAQPVFDRKNSTHGEGNLLGVMGTDVPIEEIIKLTPQYKLGPNGYSFGITNNGYILFHPQLRPMYGKSTKPNYNSVDITEVEMSEQENPYGRNYDMKLRKELLDQKTSNHSMEGVKISYDQMRRVDVQENHYYYTTLLRTPFSLGIALPVNGLYSIKGIADMSEINIDRDFGGSLWKVVPDWVYCRLPNEENTPNDRSRIIKFIKLAQASISPKTFGDKFQDEYRFYTENCDKDLIMSLAFDAKVTAPILNDWYDTEPFAQQHGIELVFLGTRSGLTRFYDVNPAGEMLLPSSPRQASSNNNLDQVPSSRPLSAFPPNDISFVEKHAKTVEELYYKRADAAGPGKFLFSVQHNNFPDYTFVSQDVLEEEYGQEYTKSDVNLDDNDNSTSDKNLHLRNITSTNQSYQLNYKDMIPVPSPFNGTFYVEQPKTDVNGLYYPGIYVTASSPVVVKGGFDSSSGKTEKFSTAAVVGLRMKLDYLAQIFYNTSPSIDCFGDGTMCYLLDEHAYVILSSGRTPRHIGKFFGQVDGRIMHTLANHIYKKITLYDYQAMCETKVSIFSAAVISTKQFIYHLLHSFTFLWKYFLQPLAYCCLEYMRLIEKMLSTYHYSLTLNVKTFIVTSTFIFSSPSLLASGQQRNPPTPLPKQGPQPATSSVSKLTKFPRISTTIPPQANKGLSPSPPSTSLNEEFEEERSNDIKIFKAPHLCAKRYHLFTLNRNLLANEGPVSLISNCGGKLSLNSITTKYDKLRFCGKPFIVSLVPYTNLLLIVVRRAQSSFFDTSGLREQDRFDVDGTFGKGGKGGDMGNSGLKDICSLCDDLVFNYQPKSISLKHAEVLNDVTLETTEEEDVEDTEEYETASLLKAAESSGKKTLGISDPINRDKNYEKLLQLKKRHRKRLKQKNKCYGVRTHVYRRRPTTCYSHHKLENTELCGSALNTFRNHDFYIKFITICFIVLNLNVQF